MLGSMVDPESTKRRIFAAAVEEFAEYGPAGARVDRIAAKARANKESIYRYFGTKEELLRRVIDLYLDEQGEQMEPRDDELPEYATNLSRFHAAHPEFLRMSLWEALEFGSDVGEGSLEHRRQHYDEKLAAVARQQEEGLIDPSLDPRHLLAVLFGMVNYCQILPQMTRLLFGAELTEADAERHREFIEECIRRIIEPRTGADQVKRYSNQHDPA
jgi:AcrR family transcriptional regulator